ncbi:MAG: type I restriction endonuclease subunit R [Pseudomonadota bacterium]
MNKIGQPERQTQNRVVQLFQNQLNYRYLGNWQDRHNNRNIETDILKAFLQKRQGYSDTLISKACYELDKIAGDQSKSLYDINKAVYRLLRYGIKVKVKAAAHKKTVWLINWKEPLKNDFAIAQEVTIKGENTKRPDIVLYINGIALAVIELKRSTVSVSQGIRQNLDNQNSIFIKAFFATQQLLMAGNDTQGLRYGTIETPEKYYLTWKEDSHNPLDRHITQICKKERLLEIIHDFIVFDRGIKKLCRPNQYFGVKAAQQDIQKRKGGIIWHTQGSGKSLTMVWLTKWLREHIENARVLIITDRQELDQQIEKVFKGVNEDIYRTKSGNDLITKLNETNPWLLCSLIHKFGKSENYDNYIDELTKNLPKNFRAKGELYVFVDECHRTQSGKLHQAMKKILPNAVLIGFTGTPLLKQDKQKSIEIFGAYIHTYKFNEAVADQVILDLRYEARNIDQNISSPKRIDQWFEAKTQGLTEIAKTELKKRWGTLQKVLSSEDRLSKIVNDIWVDMNTKPCLQNGKGNAMLVSGSIYQACKYYELFQKVGLKQCAIISSYNPSIKDIKGESTGEEGFTEKLRQYEIYTKMLKGKNTADFETEVKEKFINEPAQMKLLIVVDKLLTGFDAPSATYLYLDKTMRDHSLFQAICRVNRLDGEDKEYGYIIDYKDLFKSLAQTVHDYTSQAFDQYEPEDVAGLLTNRLEKAKERLDMALETIKALCEPVEAPKDSLAYIRYFCGSSDKKRLALYKYTVGLIRAYANLANEMQAAGYSVAETENIKKEVKYYTNLREEIKKASGDYIDLKAYEPAMRHLIDTYVRAEESETVSAFDDMTLVQIIVEKGIKDTIKTLPKGIRANKAAVAETIQNNLRKVITEEKPTNPKYFEQMSELLNALIKARQEQAKSYEAYLAEIIELAKKINNPASSTTYPNSLNSNAKRALYDNLDKNEGLALTLDSEIQSTKKDDWRGNKIKEREIKYTLKKHIPADKVDDIFKIVKNQQEY